MKRKLGFFVLCFTLLLSSGLLFACNQDDATKYTVSIAQIENGQVSSSKGEYSAGEAVSLSVTANDGYVLKILKVGDIQLAGTSFVMPKKDVEVTAIFEKQYEININQSLGGNIVLSSSKAVNGEVITFEAIANTGYSFMGVYVNLVKTSNTWFTMPNEDVALTPIFEEIESGKEVNLKYGTYVIETIVDTEGNARLYENDRYNFIKINQDNTATFGAYIYELDLLGYFLQENLSYERNGNTLSATITLGETQLPIDITIEDNGDLSFYWINGNKYYYSYKSDFSIIDSYTEKFRMFEGTQEQTGCDETLWVIQDDKIYQKGYNAGSLEFEVLVGNYSIYGDILIIKTDDGERLYTGRISGPNSIAVTYQGRCWNLSTNTIQTFAFLLKH